MRFAGGPSPPPPPRGRAAAARASAARVAVVGALQLGPLAEPRACLGRPRVAQLQQRASSCCPRRRGG
eukprot:3988016-Prymnesium_polylepis.1